MRTSTSSASSLTGMAALRGRFAYVLTALLGGYAFTWGFIALGMAGLFAAGMDFHDAESLASIVGLLVFLVAFLCTFSARRLKRAWLILAGGGLLMAGIASLLQFLVAHSN